MCFGMPRLSCRVCGGEHLTVQCLREREATPPSVPSRPRSEEDWIEPEHSQMLDIIEKLRGPGRDIVLEGGPDRDHILEGVRQGAYSRLWHANAEIRVGRGMMLFIDGRQTCHGSLWTRKTEADRHRDHVRNCVKDSQAWKERPPEADLEKIVETMISQFGEFTSDSEKWYVREGSVKVFRLRGGRSGPKCSHCKHCDAYRFLNSLLGCHAVHGPRRRGRESNGE